MIYFKNIEFLWLLILVVPLIFLIKNRTTTMGGVFSKDVLNKISIKNRSLSKKVRNILIIISMILAIFAISRPQIDEGEIKVKSSFINVVAAIDMSKSMFANDIYPSRFEFAKNKFFNTLENFKNAKVALIGFSTQTFLISPLTEDFHSLKFLAKNLNLDYLSLKGTDILATLKSANDLFSKEKKKILLLYTDGGDQKEFSKEIEYAKEHNIAIYIYNIGTQKGGVIKTKDGVLKDKNGDIVVVKRDDSIKELALQSGGAYMKYSLKKDDIKILTDTIQKRYKAKDENISTIKDTKELFYYPLGLAILLFFISMFSLPRREKV
jgi:Ca-activated chloride channel family protein